jgi:hypothetical protein
MPQRHFQSYPTKFITRGRSFKQSVAENITKIGCVASTNGTTLHNRPGNWREMKTVTGRNPGMQANQKLLLALNILYLLTPSLC